MISKKDLRIHLKNIRRYNDETEKKRIDNLIADRFLNSEIFRNSDSVLIYVSYGSEIDTYGIIKRALADNKIVAVPCCSGASMEFYKLNAVDDLVPGSFGILTVDTENKLPFYACGNTVCVVPGLGFDEDGNRIGYGGGYYDRFRERARCDFAAVCQSAFLLPAIPCEAHDRKMKIIVTPQRVLRFEEV